MFQRLGERIRERTRMSRPAESPRAHALEAVGWIYRAQDAHEDGGVSHSYLLGKGWMPSYPETTGYIIPTLLNWNATTGDEEARRRALAMAQWELRVRLPNGAIPNLIDGTPTVFDTGQVLFGWLAAYGATEDSVYLQAAVDAGEWLLGALDADGVWRHASDSGGPGRVYNVCVAWALAELATVKNEPRYAEAVRPFLQWTLEQEREAGWFERNCLTDDTAPLLHTIAYTARGQLECGLRLQWSELLSASRRTAAALASQVAEDGRMAGRFGRHWKPTVSWACLTGMAQMGIVWHRLHALEQNASEAQRGDMLRAAARVSDFLRRSQDRTSKNGALRGGIRGSYPVHGAYGRDRILNWATKYFIDAMVEEMPEKRTPYAF